MSNPIYDLIQRLSIPRTAKDRLWRGVKDDPHMTLDLFKSDVCKGLIIRQDGIGLQTAAIARIALKKLEREQS